jgi:hypothetical protein
MKTAKSFLGWSAITSGTLLAAIVSLLLNRRSGAWHGAGRPLKCLG